MIDSAGGLAVATTDVVVSYDAASGPVTALAHPALTIHAGTSVAMMGPSGCGKSTLLGLVAGLAVPTSGEISVGETIVSSLGESERVLFRRRHLGMIYQADNLLPHLTVEENIAVAPAIAGRAGDNPADLIVELGLGGLATRFPDQLSGGQRQRVAVARAVACRPQLVLADEPTGALDESTATGVIDLLLDAQRRLEATLILVTHDPAIAGRCDRIEHLRRPGHPRASADVA